MTTLCCRKINMPISSEVKSNNSHYAGWFGPILFLFFVCHIFSVCRGESSFRHLISWIFVPLFQGGSGSAYAKVHWGEGGGGASKRERQRGGDQSLSHKLQSVSQSSAITRDSEDILPDTRGCRPHAVITEPIIYF